MKNYYTILGLTPAATAEQIKFAYRHCCRAHHPDRGGDHSTMADVNEAYAVLSDPARRAQFDAGVPEQPELPTPWEQMAMMALAQAMNSHQHNPLEGARTTLANRQAAVRSEQSTIRQEIYRAARVAELVKFKGQGKSLLHEQIAAAEAHAQELLESNDAQIVLIDRALEVLAQYEWTGAVGSKAAEAKTRSYSQNPEDLLNSLRAAGFTPYTFDGN